MGCFQLFSVWRTRFRRSGDIRVGQFTFVMAGAINAVVIVEIGLRALLFPHGHAGFSRSDRLFPAVAKDWPLFEDETHLRVGFDGLFDQRGHAAAIQTLVIEEFYESNFGIFRAIAWRCRVI